MGLFKSQKSAQTQSSNLAGLPEAFVQAAVMVHIIGFHMALTALTVKYYRVKNSKSEKERKTKNRYRKYSCKTIVLHVIIGINQI